MTAGEAITKYQKASNPPLTDADLARLWGVFPSIVCRIKSGDQKPGNPTWNAIRSRTPKLFIVLQQVYYGGE